MQAVQNHSLSNHAVRIKINGQTQGTGFLVVPNSCDFAYVVTAAHVVSNPMSGINIEFLSDACEEKQLHHINTDDIILHPGYIPSLVNTEVQPCDVALIRIQKHSWMTVCSNVYWGTPVDNMPIEAIAFTFANSDRDIRHATTYLSTHIRVYTPDNHRISAVIDGEFRLDDSDRNYEIEGMSGSVFAAKEQNSIILIGIFCSTTGNNAAHGQMNIVDMSAIIELCKLENLTIPKCPVQFTAQTDNTNDILTMAIHCDVNFVSRNSELQQMEEALRSSSIVALSGMGGIGKTKLALQYASIHQNEYTAFQSVDCSDGIAIGFAQYINIPRFERYHIDKGLEADRSFGLRKLDWIRKYGHSYLLLLDNVALNDPDYPAILTLPTHRIIATRWDNHTLKTSGCPIINVNALSTIEDRQSLFETYYEKPLDNTEYADFEAIDTLVEGHTLTLQLIALQCITADLLLSQVRHALENHGIYTKNPNTFSYEPSMQEQNMYGHIRALWTLSSMCDDMKSIMLGISLLSPHAALRSHLQAWMKLDNLNAINSLIRMGWIESQRLSGSHNLRVHMVIADVICQELMETHIHTISSLIETIHQHMTNRDMNYSERVMNVGYGEQMAKRLPPSKGSIKFIQDLSMEEEYFRNFDKAYALLNRSEGYIHKLNLCEDILKADNDSDMAVILQGERNLEEAYVYFRKAGALYAARQDFEPARYAVHLYNEARLLQEMDRMKEAFMVAQNAMTLCAQHAPNYIGKVFDVYANHYSYLARSEAMFANAVKSQDVAQRHMKKVIQYINLECTYWQKAVAAKEHYNPKDGNDMMVSNSYLACAYAMLQSKEAIPLINSVLDYYIRTTDENSVHVANTYNLMCIIYEKLEDYKLSLMYGELAAKTYIKLFGCDSYELESVYHNLIFPLQKLGEVERVAYYKKEQQRIAKLHK